jgi:hypothetical protein
MRIKLIKLKPNIINHNDTGMNTGNFFFAENDNNSCHCFYSFEIFSILIKAIDRIFSPAKKNAMIPKMIPKVSYVTS